MNLTEVQVSHKPSQIVERALGLIRDEPIQNKKRSSRDVPAHSICIRSNARNVPQIAQTILTEYEMEGIESVGLRAIAVACLSLTRNHR